EHPGSEYRRLPDIDAGEVRIHAERRSAIERRCQRLIEPSVTRLDRRLLVAQGVPRDAQARREAELRRILEQRRARRDTVRGRVQVVEVEETRDLAVQLLRRGHEVIPMPVVEGQWVGRC